MKLEVQYAAQAAKTILGFYDTIPAADPKAFAAGLVEILSSYPRAVIDRAARPAGLASHVAYPNLAKMTACLDKWRDEYFTDQDRIAKANRKRLPERPRDPDEDARILKGLQELAEHLKRGFGPSTQ